MPSRIDKHRLLHGGSVFITFFNPAKLIEWNADARLIAAPLANDIRHKPLRHEVEVACYRFDPKRPDPEIRVIATPSLSIAYGAAPAYLQRVEVSDTTKLVRSILNDFSSLVPRK